MQQEISPSWPQVPHPSTPNFSHLGYFSSPLTFPNQQYCYGGPLILPQYPSNFSNSFPSNGNFTQSPLSFCISPQNIPAMAAPTPVQAGRSLLIENTASAPIVPKINSPSEASSFRPEPTETVICVENWVIADLEEDGKCSIAGRNIKSSQLACSERITFINDRGDIVSDGKSLFKLCGSISWELYNVQYKRIKEINPSSQLKNAFSNGFPQKSRRYWIRTLYRFLYCLAEQNSNIGQTKFRSNKPYGVADLDETNFATLDSNSSVNNTTSPPFLFLNSQNRDRGRELRSRAKNRLNSLRSTRESPRSDSFLTIDLSDREDESIPSASILGGKENYEPLNRQNLLNTDYAPTSSAPVTVEAGVQTSDDLLPIRHVKGRHRRWDVATAGHRTRGRTPISDWLQEKMRLNVLLDNADVQRNSSPPQSPPEQKQRSETRTRSSSPCYSSEESTVADADAWVASREHERNKNDKILLRPSLSGPLSRQTSLTGTTPKIRGYSLRERHATRARDKSWHREPPVPSTSSVPARSSHSLQRCDYRSSSRDRQHRRRLHQQMKRPNHKEFGLDQRHQLVTHLGVVDVRDLRRTRSGRLSVPTRDTWHRQKIVVDGADVSVDHGELGKYFSSLIND